MTLKTGPSWDFAAFYQATLKPLRRYLHRLCRCEYEAQDLAQDAYVKLFRTMNQHWIATPRAFLFTTARNLAINRFRRSNHGPLTGWDASTIERAAASEPGIERIVIARQEWAQMEQALADLPPGCRHVLLLSKIERRSHKEIASHLEISTSTVEKQLARAMRLLRKSLEKAEMVDEKARGEVGLDVRRATRIGEIR